MDGKNQFLKQKKWYKCPLWKPSKYTVFRIVFWVVILGLLSNVTSMSRVIGIDMDMLNILTCKHLDKSLLLSVHAGIGGVLIALAFFVAQSAGAENKQERSYVLMSASYFFPLLAFEIFIFITLLAKSDINVIGTIVVGAIAVCTVLSLYRVVRLLSDNQYMERKSGDALLELANDGVLNLLERDLASRKKNNELIKNFEGNSILSASPYTYIDSKNFHYIKSKEVGIIEGIDANKLRKLSVYLKKRLRISIADNTAEVIDSIHKTESKAANVISLINDSVEIDSKIFVLDLNRFDELDIGLIEKRVDQIFSIKDDHLIEDSRVKFRQLKDRCIEAIRNERTGELEKYLSFYPKLVALFLDYVGSGLSAEQAESERQPFGRRIMPYDWFIGDVEDIFDQGLKSNNHKIISQVAYFPIKLLTCAVKHQDHLFFDGFLNFSLRLYAASHDAAKVNESTYLRDRSWRYLYELLTMSLRFSEKYNELTAENYQIYAGKILLQFQGLLKHAIDKKDDKYFTALISTTAQLFDRSYVMGDEDEFQKIHNELRQRRQEMFFGTATWVLYLYKDNPQDESLQKMHSHVTAQLAQTIPTFLDEFINVSSPQSEAFWNCWGFWELEGKSEHEAHQNHFNQKMNELFVTHGLSLLRNISEEQVHQMTISPNRHLADLGSDGSSVQKILESIGDNSEEWHFLIESEKIWISKVVVFKTLLSKVQDQQDANDRTYLRDQIISQSKIEEFKKHVNKNYHAASPISSFLETFGCYEQSTDKREKEASNIGVNTLFDKPPFFPEDAKWHVAHLGFEDGFNFGESIARGETSHVFKKIMSHCTEIDKDDLHDTIRKFDSSDLIMIATNSTLLNLFGFDHPHCKQSWDTDQKESVYQLDEYKIPIYELYIRTGSDQLVLLNKNALGLFTHHIKHEGDEVCTTEVIDLATNSTAMDKLLEQNPDWLTKDRSKQEQREHLQEHVQIQISESFSFEINKKFDGYIINNSERPDYIGLENL